MPGHGHSASYRAARTPSACGLVCHGNSPAREDVRRGAAGGKYLRCVRYRTDSQEPRLCTPPERLSASLRDHDPAHGSLVPGGVHKHWQNTGARAAHRANPGGSPRRERDPVTFRDALQAQPVRGLGSTGRAARSDVVEQALDSDIDRGKPYALYRYDAGAKAHTRVTVVVVPSLLIVWATPFAARLVSVTVRGNPN